ncbi:RAB6A-GEF complex partner protein 1 isoform X1 [Arapaima gigas]
MNLGYKPFLNLIRPQLQKLVSASVDSIQPEAFQPVGTSKLEPASPRMEDSRGPAPLGASLPAEAPGGPARPTEDHPVEEQEEKILEEGTYDCTLS